MTDTDKLKRLAELLRFGDTSGEYSKAILALIAERNEAVALLRETEGLDFEMTDLDIRIDAFLARIDAANKPVA